MTNILTMYNFLGLSAFLFIISIVGIFIHRRNALLLLLCLELLLLSVNINFIGFSMTIGDVMGKIMVLIILVVAAAEAVIGLAILLAFFRNTGNINIKDMTNLGGGQQ